MLKRLDPTVRDLLTGALLYGIIVEIIGLILVENRLSYSLGILVGYICVVFMVCHMYLTLEKALDMDPDSASKFSTRNNILRYVILVIILMLVAWLPKVSVMAVIIMIFGMKISAFLQPVISKYITSKIFKERR
ncbi:MAG: ATP synthase subunit I [Lachnospiraceae bacterium]|nr:ATP synthase subunit I [Lachnospiraceae bacterium]MBP3505860.1 ATP synthase subunit I [Lachnospiraceae bacterium]